MNSYARTLARLDRDANRGSDAPLRFIAATEGRKADGIDLRMSGAQLDRFRSNPVIMYGHQIWGQNLPIGRATDVQVRGNQLLIDVEFDREDEFAVQVERKYRGGFMSAVSAGFSVTAWEDDGDHWRGGVAKEWELHEVSACPVPLDPDAVVAGGRSALLRQLEEELRDPIRAVVREELAKRDQLSAPTTGSTYNVAVTAVNLLKEISR